MRADAADRVVSLNLCTDQMLELLAPEKIAALSTLARDPSPFRSLQVRPKELSERPRLGGGGAAVASRSDPGCSLGAQATLAMLEQERIPILRISLPADFTGIRQMTRQVAHALDVAARGEVLLGRMDTRLAELPHVDRGIRALVWEPRGFTAGPGTLMDSLLRAAGLSNASDGRRVDWRPSCATHLICSLCRTTPAYPSLATSGVATSGPGRIPRRTIPPALTICAGPFSAQAVALLAQ